MPEESSIFMSGEFKLLEEARAAMFLLELSSTEAIAFAFVKSNFNACFELKSVSESPPDDEPLLQEAKPNTAINADNTIIL